MHVGIVKILHHSKVFLTFLLNAHCFFSWKTGSIVFEYGILPDSDGTIQTKITDEY